MKSTRPAMSIASAKTEILRRTQKQKRDRLNIHTSKDILPFQTEIILWLLHLKVTSGISLSKPSALIQCRNTDTCPECLYLPFSLPGQIKYFIFYFFWMIFLILLTTIADCCGSKKLLLQAIMAKGRHKLGLVNYCSIPTRIWDLMHERWDFSFHATAARLCPMCLFGG